MDVFTLHSINVTGTGAFLIDQIEAFALNPNTEPLVLGSDGEVDPRFAATMAAAPTITATTSALKDMLDKASGAFLLQGQKLVSGGLAADCYFQKLTELETRATGSVHKRMAIGKGLIVPRAISASQNGHATMGLEIVAIQDGTTEPVVVTDAALAGAPELDEVFTLGPVKLNGSDLPGVQGVSVDPGLSLTIHSGNGKVYPQYAAIMSRAPSITVALDDASVLSTITLNGLDISSLDVYFRKVLEGSTRVADATEEHIKISVADGMGHLEAISVNHNGHAAPGIKFTPTKTGTTDIFTIDTTSAIV